MNLRRPVSGAFAECAIFAHARLASALDAPSFESAVMDWMKVDRYCTLPFTYSRDGCGVTKLPHVPEGFAPLDTSWLDDRTTSDVPVAPMSCKRKRSALVKRSALAKRSRSPASTSTVVVEAHSQEDQ